MAVASPGIALQHQRGDIYHYLAGAQIVCLESMNHDRFPSGLQDEITTSNRVFQEVLEHPLSCVAHVSSTWRVPLRSAPTIDASTPLARANVTAASAALASRAITMPRPQLKTLTISSEATGPRR